jgi:hypothetical protein
MGFDQDKPNRIKSKGDRLTGAAVGRRRHRDGLICRFPSDAATITKILASFKLLSCCCSREEAEDSDAAMPRRRAAVEEDRPEGIGPMLKTMGW